MTKEYRQQKFSELIYDLCEIRFDAIKTGFCHKHINKNESFTDKQIEVFTDFANDIVCKELSELFKTYIR
jgi:hypothetical protein